MKNVFAHYLQNQLSQHYIKNKLSIQKKKNEKQAYFGIIQDQRPQVIQILNAALTRRIFIRIKVLNAKIRTKK